MIQCTDSTSRVAVMGGAYGNAPALLACLEDARLRKCSRIAFLGDAIGCCGHSDQTLDLLRRHVDVFVAGNHEQQAAAGESTCGCNYADPRDEMIGCQAFELALKSLGRANQEWVRTWPAKQVLDFAGGRVLLCHGSPDQTSEFLFESQLDDQRLEAWLDRHDAKVLACTHTGLPWIRHLDGGRLALNCGVVGKPDHDGDTAVHYAIVKSPGAGRWTGEIVDVHYDALQWAKQLRSERVPEIFISPLLTGLWTSGLASLPPREKQRPQARAISPPVPPSNLTIHGRNAFDRLVGGQEQRPLRALSISTVQVNIGLRCNLACHHCHVESSPSRDEQMSWETMEMVLDAAQKSAADTIDITGGAPEMHTHFRRFVASAREIDKRVIVRTNLTIVQEKGYHDLPVFFKHHRVHLIASLPCYLENNVDKQRGRGVYVDSINVIKRLNEIGYGIDPDLPLDLVFNPGGACLPPHQAALEESYRKELDGRFGIRFTRLLTITNIPIGRFLHDLQRQGKAEQYQQLLRDSFNVRTLDGLMCRHQLHVGWDGTLFDCDFNFAIGLPVNSGACRHIRDFSAAVHLQRWIATGEHCFGCTAGSGSSCGGALT